MMEFIKTPISGLMLAKLSPICDERGYFTRLYCHEKFASVGFGDPIVQSNQSMTVSKGTVRGMHYQLPPYSETKFVRCTSGRIWDVAVDIRQDSASFGQWFAQELTPDNFLMMLIPAGFAHGFQALEDGSSLLYMVSAPYSASAERGLRFDDPALAIEWPLEPIGISPKDRLHPLMQR
jgi:dTDP-4-dehydrorhamnose 3,5-epimerase